MKFSTRGNPKSLVKLSKREKDVYSTNNRKSRTELDSQHVPATHESLWSYTYGESSRGSDQLSGLLLLHSNTLKPLQTTFVTLFQGLWSIYIIVNTSRKYVYPPEQGGGVGVGGSSSPNSHHMRIVHSFFKTNNLVPTQRSPVTLGMSL